MTFACVRTEFIAQCALLNTYGNGAGGRHCYGDCEGAGDMDGWRAWWQAVAAWVGGRSRAARVAITGRLAWLARRFAYARLLGWGLQRTGFAVAFAIIVPVLLLSSPGTDYIMGRALSDARLPGLNAVKNWAAAVALVGAWVLAAWFWSLVVLVSTPAEREPLAGALSEDARLARVRWMQRWLASWVAGAGGVLAAVVFARIAATIPPDAPNADGAQLVLRLTAVALLGVTVAALIFANRMAAVFRQRRARAHVAAMVRYHEAVRQGQPASLPDARDTIILWRWIVCLGGGAVLVGFLLATAISPDWTGTYFGALNLVLVAAMAWIGLGTTVVLLGDAWAVPLVGFVATWCWVSFGHGDCNLLFLFRFV